MKTKFSCFKSVGTDSPCSDSRVVRKNYLSKYFIHFISHAKTKPKYQHFFAIFYEAANKKMLSILHFDASSQQRIVLVKYGPNRVPRTFRLHERSVPNTHYANSHQLPKNAFSAPTT